MMKYIGILSGDVIVAKGINYTDYTVETEIELTEAQYNTIPVPCKLVDGEFIPCEMPESETPGTTTETEPTTDEILNALLGVADNE